MYHCFAHNLVGLLDLIHSESFPMDGWMDGWIAADAAEYCLVVEKALYQHVLHI